MEEELHGVSCQIIGEDPRYPKLIVEGGGDTPWTRGYWICPATGDLEEFCVCGAYRDDECICSYEEED